MNTKVIDLNKLTKNREMLKDEAASAALVLVDMLVENIAPSNEEEQRDVHYQLLRTFGERCKVLFGPKQAELMLDQVKTHLETY